MLSDLDRGPRDLRRWGRPRLRDLTRDSRLRLGDRRGEGVGLLLREVVVDEPDEGAVFGPSDRVPGDASSRRGWGAESDSGGVRWLAEVASVRAVVQ